MKQITRIFLEGESPTLRTSLDGYFCKLAEKSEE